MKSREEEEVSYLMIWNAPNNNRLVISLIKRENIKIRLLLDK